MAVRVFPLSPAPEVPPLAAIGLDDPTDTIGGNDHTPTGWPTNRKATAFEVDVTVTEEHAFDGQVGVFVSEHDTVAGIPGDWSGTPGTVGGWGSNNDVTGWRWNKFGGWRTDHLTFDTSGATGAWAQMSSSLTPSAGVDLRARVRAADWDAGGLRRLITTLVALGVRGPELSIPAAGVRLYLRNGVQATAPWSAFSEVDGQWMWLRATFDTTNGGRWYQSIDGTTWTLVHTAPMTGGSDQCLNSYRVGSTNASNPGANADISHAEVRDGTGTLVAALDLDGMTASTDTSWATRVGTAGRGTGNTVTGTTIPAQATARFEFATPTAMTGWRLFVDCDDGEITLDEVRLEVQRRGGRHLGLVRGSRGVG